MKTIIICSALAGILMLGRGQTVVETGKTNAPSPAPSEVPVAVKPVATPYQLDGTETFSLTSPETGNTYDIVVSLPANYASAPAGKTFPVVYVLDAQWQFPLIRAIAGAINYDRDIPDVFLVGISWKTTNHNLFALRDHDLTPTTIRNYPNSGHADKFQDFLRKNLFPFIESHYKANQHRAVTGGSTSSLFVYYTLLSQPDLFEGYIGSSPSLDWDNHVLDSILDKFPQDGIKHDTRAYLAWGTSEGSSEWSVFAKKLAKKNLKNLDFSYAPVSNAGHAGVNAECYTRGLQFVFARSRPPKSGLVVK